MTFYLYSTQCSTIDRAQRLKYVVGETYNCGNSGEHRSGKTVESLIASDAESLFYDKSDSSWGIVSKRAQRKDHMGKMKETDQFPYS